jgi:hypothetical protein
MTRTVRGFTSRLELVRELLAQRAVTRDDGTSCYKSPDDNDAVLAAEITRDTGLRTTAEYVLRHRRALYGPPIAPHAAGLFYAARLKTTGEYLTRIHTNGERSRTPSLYESPRRALQAVTSRYMDVAEPSDWEVVAVTLEPQNV